ncbi:hypothetical protein HW132_15365 [Brasilonema sp. CT11]|nr:hypothetical protein [Brasilonema sp. CT11]
MKSDLILEVRGDGESKILSEGVRSQKSEVRSQKSEYIPLNLFMGKTVKNVSKYTQSEMIGNN